MDSTSLASSRKTLYKGVFNWHGEIFTLHKRAHSSTQAYKMMCTDIAHRVGMTSWAVRQYFSPDKDRYEVVQLLDNHAKNGYNKTKRKGANNNESE